MVYGKKNTLSVHRSITVVMNTLRSPCTFCMNLNCESRFCRYLTSTYIRTQRNIVMRYMIVIRQMEMSQPSMATWLILIVSSSVQLPRLIKANEIPNGTDPHIIENIQAHPMNPKTLLRRMRSMFSSGLQIAKYCVVAIPSILSVFNIPNAEDTNDPAIIYNKIRHIPEWCNKIRCKTSLLSRNNTLLQSQENTHEQILTTVRLAYWILYTDFPWPRFRVRQNKVNAMPFKVTASTARNVSMPKRQDEKYISKNELSCVEIIISISWGSSIMTIVYT